MNRLGVSVVICAYTEHRWADLAAAIASVERQTTPAGEIILVVDHNDELLERARGSFSGAVVIPNRDYPGLSGARNSGLRVARGGIVAFLDDDAVAEPDWIDHLMRGYDDPNVLGVGGLIQPLWQGGRPAWFPEEFDWVVGCTYKGMPEILRPVRNLIGCNMSFRREIFASIGGFRSGIGRVGTRPVGCDETELCIRVRQSWPGCELLFNPRAIVRHRVPPERATWSYFRSRCFAEGLSKALVAGIVGVADGLANERAYTRSTLPYGVARSLASALRRADIGGIGRAGAIAAGLAVTTAGYAAGLALSPFSRRPSLGIAIDAERS